MNPEVALTRINLGSPPMMGVPGGRPEITRQDIMAALGMGGLDAHCYHMALAYYAGDMTYHKELGYKAWDVAVHLSIDHKWSKTERGKQQLRHVSGVALWDILTEHQRVCRHCNGDGARPSGSKAPAPEGVAITACPRCRGWGYEHLSENTKALKAGIPASTWHDTWVSRYRHIRQGIYDWLLTAEAHVRRHMGS